MLFFAVAAQISLPTSGAHGFSFLHILPMLVISRLFNNSYSNMCEVIHHYGVFFSIMILIYISILVMLGTS